MNFLIPSFLAGILTVLAPCVIALLPVILGGTLGTSNKMRPLTITLSLGVSVIVFTLLLKATTALLGIHPDVWATISGGLVFIFGLTLLFPKLWNILAFKLKLYKSEQLVEKSSHKEGLTGAMLLGASLGPVFTTCSPTYALILSVVLPQNFAIGFINLVVYSIGLILPLLLIGYGGQKVTQKLRFAVNPNGWFKKSLGILLIVTGIMITTGLDKDFEAWILEKGYLGPIGIESRLIENFEN